MTACGCLASDCWHSRISGYVLVLTRSGEGGIEDFRTYGPANYGTVVEDAHALRLAAGDEEALARFGPLAPTVEYDYARIDVLYVDGSRGIL